MEISHSVASESAIVVSNWSDPCTSIWDKGGSVIGIENTTQTNAMDFIAIWIWVSCGLSFRTFLLTLVIRGCLGRTNQRCCRQPMRLSTTATPDGPAQAYASAFACANDDRYISIRANTEQIAYLEE